MNRQRKCKVCRSPFVPRSMGHKACSLECALSLAQSDRAKKERKELLSAKRKARGRSYYVQQAQQATNALVRARDADLPCISCGRMHGGQWHAGHYLSVGARPNLRFDLRNIHRQCQPCNTHLHGNLVNYRIGLIARHGIDLVEALEADHAPRKHTIDELIEIRRAAIEERKRIGAER